MPRNVRARTERAADIDALVAGAIREVPINVAELRRILDENWSNTSRRKAVYAHLYPFLESLVALLDPQENENVVVQNAVALFHQGDCVSEDFKDRLVELGAHTKLVALLPNEDNDIAADAAGSLALIMILDPSPSEEWRGRERVRRVYEADGLPALAHNLADGSHQSDITYEVTNMVLDSEVPPAACNASIALSNMLQSADDDISWSMLQWFAGSPPTQFPQLKDDLLHVSQRFAHLGHEFATLFGGQPQPTGVDARLWALEAELYDLMHERNGISEGNYTRLCNVLVGLPPA